MISRRRACLALFHVAAASCGVGCSGSDASKDPASAPAVQQRTEQIDRFKARSAKTARKPGR